MKYKIIALTQRRDGITRAKKSKILSMYACGGRNPGSHVWSGKMNNRNGNTRKRETFGYTQQSQGKKSTPPPRPASSRQMKVQTSRIHESLSDFSNKICYNNKTLAQFSVNTTCRVYYLLDSIQKPVDYQGYKGIIDSHIEELIKIYGEYNHLEYGEVVYIYNEWDKIVKNLFHIF